MYRIAQEAFNQNMSSFLSIVDRVSEGRMSSETMYQVVGSQPSVVSSASTKDLANILSKLNGLVRSNQGAFKATGAQILAITVEHAPVDFIDEKLSALIEDISLLLKGGSGEGGASSICIDAACVATSKLVERAPTMAPDAKRMLANAVGRICALLIDLGKDSTTTVGAVVPALISMVQYMPSACRASSSGIMGVALNQLDSLPELCAALLSSLSLTSPDGSSATTTLLARLVASLDLLITTTIEDDSTKGGKPASTSGADYEAFTLLPLKRSSSGYYDPAAVVARCTSLCAAISYVFKGNMNSTSQGAQEYNYTFDGAVSIPLDYLIGILLKIITVSPLRKGKGSDISLNGNTIPSSCLIEVRPMLVSCALVVLQEVIPSVRSLLIKSIYKLSSQLIQALDNIGSSCPSVRIDLYKTFAVLVYSLGGSVASACGPQLVSYIVSDFDDALRFEETKTSVADRTDSALSGMRKPKGGVKRKIAAISSSSDPAHGSDSNGFHAGNNAAVLTHAALCATAVYTVGAPLLDLTTKRKLDEGLLRLTLSILSPAVNRPPTLRHASLRAALLESLRCAVLAPRITGTTSSLLPYAIQIFKACRNDSVIEVVSAAAMALACCECLLHPRAPALLLPSTVDVAASSSKEHANNAMAMEVSDMYQSHGNTYDVEDDTADAKNTESVPSLLAFTTKVASPTAATVKPPVASAASIKAFTPASPKLSKGKGAIAENPSSVAPPALPPAKVLVKNEAPSPKLRSPKRSSASKAPSIVLEDVSQVTKPVTAIANNGGGDDEDEDDFPDIVMGGGSDDDE